MPVVSATFAQDFEASRDSIALAIRTKVRFVSVESQDLGAGTGMGYPLADGVPVVIDPPELIRGSVAEQYGRDVDVLDNATGIIAKLPTSTTPGQSSMVAWTRMDAEEKWRLFEWLHQCRGRWRSFWLPSWNKDVVITKNIVAGDDFIEVIAVGFAATYGLPCWLEIRFATSRAIQKIISVSTDGAPGTERLHFSGAFSGGAPASSVVRVSKLTRMRLNADRIEVQHRIGGDCVVAVPTTEVPE